eukprot:448452-Amphidinium_carterae.1
MVKKQGVINVIKLRSVICSHSCPSCQSCGGFCDEVGAALQARTGRLPHRDKDAILELLSEQKAHKGIVSK